MEHAVSFLLSRRRADGDPSLAWMGRECPSLASAATNDRESHRSGAFADLTMVPDPAERCLTALAEAPLVRPLSRPQADRILRQVLRRVADVNRKPFYLCRVTAVGVFGEYVTDAPLLADLDLVVRLVPKESVPGESHEVRKTHRRLPYWRLRLLLPEHEWPQWRERHVELYLVAGLRRLVLHRFDDPILRGQRVRLVFLENPGALVADSCDNDTPD
jgi:hypothetical protein